MQSLVHWPDVVNPESHQDASAPPPLDATHFTMFDLAHELRLGGDIDFLRDEIRSGRLHTSRHEKRTVIPSKVVLEYLAREHRRIPNANTEIIKALAKAWASDPLISARQLINMKATFEWIIKGWLPRGSIALMVGKPHEGKSYLGLDLAVAVAASGQRFLKQPVRAHGPVLIVSTQDREPRLKQRLLRLCRGRGLTKQQMAALPIYFFVPEKPIHLEAVADIAALKAMVKSTLPVLVVLDLWTDFVGGKDENKPGVIGDATEPLREMKNKLGCTFLALCHSPKGQWHGGAADLTARGSGHLEGSADTKLTLKKTAKRGQRARPTTLGVWCRDSNVGSEPPLHIQLHVGKDEKRRESHRWRLVSDVSGRGKTAKAVHKQVVDAIREFETQHHRPPNTRELRACAHLGNYPGGKKLADVLSDMESKGLIKAIPQGKRKRLWTVV